MLGGLNGFNLNAYFDFNDAHEQNLKTREERETTNLASNSTVAQPNSRQTERVDYYALDPDELNEDELTAWAQNVEFAKLNDKQKNRLLAVKMGFKKPVYKPFDPVLARKSYSLSGYTAEDKISVWGKINGLDPNIGKNEAAELKRFIDSTKALRSNSFDRKNDVFSVDGFTNEFHIHLGSFGSGETKGMGLGMEPLMTELLDSDIDLEEFKDKWLEFTAERILGEYANVKISLANGALNFDQTTAKPRETTFGQKMQNRVSYADEASKKKFLKFLKEAFKNGESIGDMLQNIALKKGDFDEKIGEKAQADAAKENKFKPIKATSKSQTYVYKDIKREFFEKFIKAEQEKGADVGKLLEALNKIKKLDVSA